MVSVLHLARYTQKEWELTCDHMARPHYTQQLPRAGVREAKDGSMKEKGILNLQQHKDTPRDSSKRPTS